MVAELAPNLKRQLIPERPNQGNAQGMPSAPWMLYIFYFFLLSLFLFRQPPTKVYTPTPKQSAHTPSVVDISSARAFWHVTAKSPENIFCGIMWRAVCAFSHRSCASWKILPTYPSTYIDVNVLAVKSFDLIVGSILLCMKLLWFYFPTSPSCCCLT